jgi:hypothetical protein
MTLTLYGLIERGKARATKRKSKREKLGLPTLKKDLEKELDRVFSEFIRLRDMEHRVQRSRCITCGKLFHWRRIQAGHFISRAYKATRYDERNVNAQCRRCNVLMHGRQFEHGLAIDKLHGPGTAKLLYDRSRMPCKRDAYAYRVLIDQYTTKVKQLKKEKGV